MTVKKAKPKQLLQPITAGANSVMNQSQFLATTCNLLEVREKSQIHGVIGFGFASHWLRMLQIQLVKEKNYMHLFYQTLILVSIKR